jgi:hypothetical protein
MEMRGNMSRFDKLRRYLAGMPTGAVGTADPIEKLLAQDWDEFEGSDDGGMKAYKLLGRTEKMEWNPPLLTFSLERHGGTARGSTRAEIQSWTINIETGTASVASNGFRLVQARDPNWDAETVARKLAQLIIAEQKSDPRLIRNPKGHVRPNIGRIVPSGYKQTREGRSQRLWAALIAELRPHNWVKVGKHFEKVK